jgi:PAS domain-containing protein
MSDTSSGTLKFDRPDFVEIFENLPGLYLILDARFTIVAQNRAHAAATLTRSHQTIGRPLFEVFPDNPAQIGSDGVSSLRASLLRVLKTRQPDQMDILKYDVQRAPEDGGQFETRYWSVLNTPILGPDGYVRWILNRAEDVTELAQLRSRWSERQNFIREQERIVEQLREARLKLAETTEENARLRAAAR